MYAMLFLTSPLWNYVILRSSKGMAIVRSAVVYALEMFNFAQEQKKTRCCGKEADISLGEYNTGFDKASSKSNGAWLSLAERGVRDAEVEGSNPFAPIRDPRGSFFITENQVGQV